MTVGALSPAQVFSARTLLHWQRRDLAAHAAASLRSIQVYEVGDRFRADLDLYKIRKVFEAAGVEFIQESGVAGVRLRKTVA